MDFEDYFNADGSPRILGEDEKFASVLVSDLHKSNEETLRLRARIAELELENQDLLLDLGVREKRIAELEEFVRECAPYRVAWAEKLLGERVRNEV